MQTPCDPRTLTRAARDMKEKEPLFAAEAGLAALRWLLEGYGYEITSLDVQDALSFTIEAAANLGCRTEIFERIHSLLDADKPTDQFVRKILVSALSLQHI